jgi:Zn-dependent protease with chaperone function
VSWRYLTLSLTLAPALFAWWSGRKIVRLIDDPALAERLLQRQTQQQVMLYACAAAPMLAGVRYAWLAVPCAIVGAWIGDLPARRVLFDEHWSLGTYLSWQARVALAWLGFWALLLVSPLLVTEAPGPWRLPLAVVLAVLLVAWNHRHPDVFLWLVRAIRIDAPASWEEVLRRSRVSRPRLFRLPVPGGRFVNAFALPSRRGPAVLFSQSLLESFDEDEQAAILGHELAHLEYFEGPRLRRAGSTIDAIALASTVGVALVLRSLADLVSAVLIALLWTGVLLGGLIWWLAAHKAHESKSDERAVALCGDAEALVRGLVKLTVLSGLPRRWGSDFERACSHPSLARRIQVIRQVAGIATLPLERPIAVPGATPGAFVVFEADRVSWLDGVPRDCPDSATEMQGRARRVRTVSYSDLVDLRVTAGVFGPDKLVATDSAGRSWALPVASAAIPTLQGALDRTDGLLAHRTVVGAPPAVGRVVALMLIGVAVLGQACGTAFFIGGIALLRPSRAALAGVAAVGVSCALLDLDALGRVATAGREVVGVVAAGLVTAAAAWLATRRRQTFERRVDLLLPLGAYAAAAVLVWTPLLWEVGREVGALPLGVAIHRTPATWIIALALSAALLTVPGWPVRVIAGALTAAVLVSVLAVSIADRRGVAAVVEASPGAAPRSAALVARIELPAGSSRLRLSPTGHRFAVALPGRRTAPRFLTGTLDGGHLEIPALDLQFIDDDHVLVVASAGDAHVVQHVDVRALGTPRWQAAITDPPDPYLQYVQDGRWAIAGANAARAFVGAFGRLGDTTVEYHRWRPDRTARGERFSVWALSPEQALAVVTFPTAIARTPWGPLVYWRSGQSTESRVWVLHDDIERHLATWPGQIRCAMASQAVRTAVCVGWRAWEGGMVVWRLRPDDSVGRPLAIPGDVWRWGVSHDASLLAVHAGDIVTLVDLDRQSFAQRRVQPEPGFTQSVIPTARRLAMLWESDDTRILAVYEVAGQVALGRAAWRSSEVTRSAGR